jgi:hypothetical protein
MGRLASNQGLELSRVVDNEWASCSLPGVVCFGDSGAPTFTYDPSTGRKDDHVIAVASDGGDVCFSRDDRARVDTDAARDWVRRTIAQTIPKHLERRPWPRRVGALSGKTSSRSCQDEERYGHRAQRRIKLVAGARNLQYLDFCWTAA